MPPYDIFTLLEKDHRDIHLLMSGIIADCENEKEIAPERFTRICELVEEHTLIEEMLIYPQAEQEDRVATIAEQAYGEHEQYKTRLYALRDITDPDALARKCRELLDLMMIHHNAEEDTLFPTLKDLWGEETLNELGDRMRILQKRHGHFEPQKSR